MSKEIRSNNLNLSITSMTIAEQENISKSVEHEILKVERQRALIFAILAGSLAIIWATLSYQDNSNDNPFKNLPIVRMIRGVVLAGFAGFELFIWRTLSRCLNLRKSVPAIWQYIIAFVEISLPTVLIFISSHALFVHALFLPPVFVYFLVIILSGLRLNFFICIFTGAVAAIEYGLLAFCIINTNVLPLDYNETHPNYNILTHLIKGFMLLAAGIITGIITNKLKNGFLKSFQSISEKAHIMSMFGQHVSPAVMEKLLHQKNSTEGDVQNVCVMFLDIRNFTKFSESRTPQEVVAYLNSLFDFMIDIVNRNNGIINKFLGDGFMAVFGAPFSNGLDSCNAVNASKEILQKLKEEIEAGNILPTTVGIGLHNGEAVAGNIGSIQRKEYTIIGDVVNLASRIESLNKQFNSQFLISDTVKEAIGDAGNDAVSLGKVTIKGRAEPIEIFKLA
ncbi:MAG: adenylate/guanylate cyclase domain-containing protein [Planctomycetota bacterium]|nr:adenylate/guanylate cyclase domain-containing protein [Planctomycetota bacterium]